MSAFEKAQVFRKAALKKPVRTLDIITKCIKYCKTQINVKNLLQCISKEIFVFLLLINYITYNYVHQCECHSL